ncbi:MAG: reverse transcriptase domain-containing protein [Bacilli bacterium]
MSLEEIFCFENLYNAHKMCRKSKQQKGEVIRFEINLFQNIYKIINEIKNNKYEFGKYREFTIFEPKKRIIEAPSYKDRIVIRCFCDNCLKPKIENKLIYDNAACRKNKGTTFAINRLHKFLRDEFNKNNKNNNIYFLKCDIKKYFPSIDHNILINELKKINFCEDEIYFIKKLLKAKDKYSNIGLPLGNQSSQWFALFYLNSVDRLIKEKLRIKSYTRYMDDMILIHKDKSYLQKCLKEIESLCNDKLQLSLNNKTQIGKVSNGIDFLGYRHILNNNGKVIVKLRSSSKRRLLTHLKVLKKLEIKNIIDEEYIYIRKNAFYNHIKKTNESSCLKSNLKSKC